jgi:predicted esterase YcpF (UPF0227 family)
MSKLIIYFYGWGGGEHSKGLISLRNQFINSEIYAPIYDQIDPKSNYMILDELYTKALDYNQVCVIGNSLGGYWANCFVEQYSEYSAILINPSLYPAETLGTYNVKEEFLQNYRPSRFNNDKKWLYLSSHDEVIDPGIAKKLLSDCFSISWLNEPHAIQNYEFMIDKIKELGFD